MNPEIFAILQSLQADNEPVGLINSYYGLPVTNEALIMVLGEDSLRLSVHPYQAVTMAIENITFITHARFPSVLRAVVSQVNFSGPEAVVTDLLYAADSIGSRANLRVQPPSRVQVVVYSQKSSSRGELLDISELGAGICTFSTLIYNPISLKRGATVRMTIDLDEFTPTLDVQGQILYTVSDGDNHRLGMKIEPDEPTRQVITQFVGQRKVVLLNELQALAEAKVIPHPAPPAARSPGAKRPG